MESIRDLWLYYAENYAYVLEQFTKHFLMSSYGVLFAALIAIPVGIFIARHSKLSSWVFSVTNVIQTVPPLAMLSILMIAMGLGTTTVILSLFLYSLLPILRNTYTGITTVDGVLLESAEGMGMTKWQKLRMVEFPLALSVIMAGVRTALVVAIGITTIGTFIGSGGLGDIIIRGTNATDGAVIILAGALPAGLMAFIVDFVMSLIEKWLSPTKEKTETNMKGMA